MIKQRTVLVVGAGASKPYGYPLGSDIVELVLGELSRIRPGRDPGDLAVSMARSLQQHRPEFVIQDFLQRLQASNAASIDRWLENQDPQLVTVGKVAIAWALMVDEHGKLRESPPRPAGDWGRYLLRQILDSQEAIEGGGLSIITFNYDTSLDTLLRDGLAAHFSDDRGVKLFSDIPIVHLHGTLDWVSELEHAARGIRIIHEVDPDDKEFRKARDLISQCEKLAFIGFGYDPTNVARLDLRNQFPRGSLLGSAKKLGTDERRRARQLFGDRSVELGRAEDDALSFLQNERVFD